MPQPSVARRTWLAAALCCATVLRSAAADAAVARQTRGAAAPPPRLDAFSSFECSSAGSQAFDFPIQNVDKCRGYHNTSDRHIRTCKLRDVCYVKGALTYYADPAVEGRAPATSRMDAFPDGGPACAGYLPLDCTCLPEKVRVVYGPRPAALQFLPGNRVHVMDRMSDPSNYAHLLLDTVISAYAAVQIYGDRPQDLQPLFLNDCQTFTDQPQHKHYRKGGEYYLLPPRMQTANELCAEKTAQWLPLAFTHEPLYPPHGDACFREVIVGHAHALSVGTMFPHRGVAVRALRRHVRRQLGLPARVDIKQHKVIVLVKTNVIRPAIDFDSCAALRNIMARDPDAPAAKVLVECIRPASMSIKEQLTAIEDATLVVSEHGSTSYISFFQTPKTSLIILGDKEAMALLSHVDVQTWFHPRSYLTSSPEWGRLPGLVMLALDRAGRKLGLERL